MEDRSTQKGGGGGHELDRGLETLVFFILPGFLLRWNGGRLGLTGMFEFAEMLLPAMTRAVIVCCGTQSTEPRDEPSSRKRGSGTAHTTIEPLLDQGT